ncbi:MAG: hypothetical protein JO250_07645 [Armatimonadetes bacterium]|nr:hypothetical protein [Armatimonadota bacterium]
MGTEQQRQDRCSVCGTPFEDTGKKQQCRRCGMVANLCCDPQMPIELGSHTEWSVLGLAVGGVNQQSDGVNSVQET